MRKHILGGISADEKKAVKAFAAQNTENALKTKPKASLACFVWPFGTESGLSTWRPPVRMMPDAYRQKDRCHLPGVACVTIRDTPAREVRHHVDHRRLGPATERQWVCHMDCTDNTSGG